MLRLATLGSRRRFSSLYFDVKHLNVFLIDIIFLRDLLFSQFVRCPWLFLLIKDEVRKQTCKEITKRQFFICIKVHPSHNRIDVRLLHKLLPLRKYTLDLSSRQLSLVARIKSLIKLCNLEIKLLAALLFLLVFRELSFNILHDLDLALEKLSDCAYGIVLALGNFPIGKSFLFLFDLTHQTLSDLLLRFRHNKVEKLLIANDRLVAGSHQVY